MPANASSETTRSSRTGARAAHVVVVGGGVSGLAAALELAGSGLRVTLLESTRALGGKLRVSEVAGVPVDEGAEAFLTRRPEGVELAAAAGLDADLVAPATSRASIWTRGRLRPLPTGQVFGIPTELRDLARSGLLTPRELARIPLDAWLPRTRVDGHTTVGGYVSARLGRGVVDRLVEPLLGGVYAGSADELALDAVLPQLAGLARTEPSLLAAAGRVRAAASSGEAAFGSLRGGLGRLPEALAQASDADIRLATPVRALHRTTTGWRLETGSAARPASVDADGVVLALPAAPAARLLAVDAPAAAAELADIAYASVAIITVAFAAGAFAEPVPGSGFLVPPVDGRLVKAATFSSQKWGWYASTAPGLCIVRLSVGRHRDEAVLQRDDADLATAAVADLADAIPLRGKPVDVRVTRWGGALPQYAPGHLGRVARIRAGVSRLPALAVCGAAYDGVGIPACAASGRDAAARVRAALVSRRSGGVRE